jgi:hypothetical protein
MENFQFYKPSIKSAELLKAAALSEGIFPYSEVMKHVIGGEGVSNANRLLHGLELMTQVEGVGGWDKLSPYSQKRVTKAMVGIGVPEKSIQDYRTTLASIPFDRGNAKRFAKISRTWESETGMPAIFVDQSLPLDKQKIVINHERIHNTHYANKDHSFWIEHTPKEPLYKVMEKSFMLGGGDNSLKESSEEYKALLSRRTGHIESGVWGRPGYDDRQFLRRAKKLTKLSETNPELFEKYVNRARAKSLIGMSYSQLVSPKKDEYKLHLQSEKLAYAHEYDETFLEKARIEGLVTHHTVKVKLEEKIMALGDSNLKRVGWVSKFAKGCRLMTKAL